MENDLMKKLKVIRAKITRKKWSNITWKMCPYVHIFFHIDNGFVKNSSQQFPTQQQHNFFI